MALSCSAVDGQDPPQASSQASTSDCFVASLAARAATSGTFNASTAILQSESIFGPSNWTFIIQAFVNNSLYETYLS